MDDEKNDVQTDDATSEPTTDEETKNDEEQVVEDTDADTKDVSMLIDAVLDKLDAMNTAINQRFDDLGAVMIASGAVITEGAGDDVEPASEDEYESLADLDYTLD